MGDYSLKDANLDALTIEDVLYIYEHYNSRCVIIQGHIKELVSQ